MGCLFSLSRILDILDERQAMIAHAGTGGNDAPDPVEAEMLDRVVRLAHDNAEAGQLPFAAVVVRSGEVIGTGLNTALRDSDPTAHGEVTAIRAACATLGTLDLSAATLVTSCEPCAMCHTTAVLVGINRVVYAARREQLPDLGFPRPGEALLREMQLTLRALVPEHVMHVPTEGAEEPFAHYLARNALT